MSTVLGKASLFVKNVGVTASCAHLLISETRVNVIICAGALLFCIYQFGR